MTTNDLPERVKPFLLIGPVHFCYTAGGVPFSSREREQTRIVCVWDCPPLDGEYKPRNALEWARRTGALVTYFLEKDFRTADALELVRQSFDENLIVVVTQTADYVAEWRAWFGPQPLAGCVAAGSEPAPGAGTLCRATLPRKNPGGLH